MKKITLFIIIFIVSCSRQPSCLEQALVLAGENRPELEMVLNHYNNNPEDHLKYKAAVFLIENMPGSFSSDSQQLAAYEPFYKQYMILDSAFAGQMTRKRGLLIDSLWKAYHKKAYQQNYMQDIKTIRHDKIISEIDLAFRTWGENVYTRNNSFSDFCEYILPYNRQSGYIADSARFIFYNRHAGCFYNEPGKDFIDETDSLLYLYHHIKHSQFFGMHIPILNAETLERLKFGLCEHRCWYNSLLLSSLGMSTAIDFVPHWGNRNGAHSWNTLIINGISYAYEPFWDNDRWKYKTIYDNNTSDSIWGNFRLPKVFRNTYSIHIEGPISDKRVSPKEIPPLFRNIKKKDVSAEYFNTTDVTVEFTEPIPDECYYSYLCVFENGNWVPVQWGKIIGNKAIYKAMGRDIVYMPVFIHRGKTLFATPPFLLKDNGEKEYFIPQTEKERIVVKIFSGSYMQLHNHENLNHMHGSILIGSLSPDLKNHNTICKIPVCKNFYSNRINLENEKKYRFIRIFLSKNTLALHDLSFFEKTPSGIQKIEGVSFISKLGNPATEGEHPELIFDEYKSSGFKSANLMQHVDIDLGKPSEITHIEFTPYINSEFSEKYIFQLFYWENGWQLASEVNGSNRHLIFENAPKNGLFRVIRKDHSTSRVFSYKNNEVFWF